MRISTSPIQIRNKFIPKTHQIPILMESSRSNSLSNSALHSSKFLTRVETPYGSPYYNQNSSIFIPSQHEIMYEPKIIAKTIRNSQNSHVFQKTIKNLSERVQFIEKQLKKQENILKTNIKMNDQKQIIDFIHEKVSHQIQKKALPHYELLFHQIKRLEHQISEKVQLQASKDYSTLETLLFVESGRQKLNEQESINNHKKIEKIMEEKIKEEIFKLQIHLENEMNKALKTIKNAAETGSQSSPGFLSASKSKLKYKYRPVQIIVKNEVRANLQDSVKRKKDSLNTQYSTGSSEENEGKNQMKVLDSEEFTYFIDKEGYLLDENGYYLLDEKDKMIKVDRKLIKKLREFKMIE